jgi:alkylhydroperoxidase family enzyme
MPGCATTDKGLADRPRLTEPRIKPLPESEWSAAQRAVILRARDAYKLPARRFPNILTTLANHPQYFERYFPYVAREVTLPARDREILIVRTGWLCRSEFELAWHTLIGRAAGVTDDDLLRIADGPNAAGSNPFEAVLVRAADELFYDTFITEATWNALARRYNQQQLMDVVFVVGLYNSIAMFLNTFGVQVDEGVPSFPNHK